MDKAKKMDWRANGEVILGARGRLQADFYKGPPSHSLNEDPFASEIAHVMESRFGDHRWRSRAGGTWSDRIRYGKNSHLHSRKSELHGSDHFCCCYKNECDGERSTYA